MAADAPSRRHEDDVAVHTLSIPNFALLDEFRVEAAALPEMIAKHAELAAGTTGPDWALVDDLVVWRRRLFLPTSASVWPMVLEHAHGMGHEGVQKRLHRLHASFTSDDNRLVRDFIRSCAVCQRNKTGHLHPAGLLQPLAVPTSVWRDIALDFIEGFPKVGSKSVIGEPIFEICPLHRPRPPILCDDGHQGIFRHHRQAPWRVGVHRQRSQPSVHQHAMEGIVPAHRHQALHKRCFPSPDGWSVRGRQQNYHGVPMLLGGRQAAFVAPLATVGRVLLQLLLPDSFQGDAVRSCVWSRTPSPVSISGRHDTRGHSGSIAKRP
jgi:hypothetical protein